MNTAIRDVPAAGPVPGETQAVFGPEGTERPMSIGRRIGRYVGSIIESARRSRQNKATYRALRGLDDRMLKDIGISRSDIRAIAHGVWNHPPDGKIG